MKRGEGVSRKSMIGHVTKGRYHVKCPHNCPFEWTRGTKWVKMLVHATLFSLYFC